MKAWHIALLGGLLAIIMLFYQGLWGDPRAIPTVLINTPARTFSGNELYSNKKISLEDYKGKVLFLNFWASWCLECRQEHPDLLRLNRQFGDHPDFAMLGIDYQDTDKDAKRYLETYGNSFEHIRDLKGTIAIDYGVYGVPESFVINRKGQIVYKQIGPIFGSAYDRLTQNVLEPLLRGNLLPSS